MSIYPKDWALPAIHWLAPIPLLLVLGSALLTIFGPAGALAFLDTSAILTDASHVLFTLMLACTPLTILFGWRWTQPLKKPLALFAFLYSAAHFIIFAAAFDFAILGTLAGATGNLMLLTGTLALLLMIPLAMTSNRWSMKRLGKWWKKLHWLTFAIAGLIMLHLLFLGQGIVTIPLYIILLGVRIPPIRRAIIGWRTGRTPGRARVPA